MLKLFKKAYTTTNDGIILALPLALFWWILTMYTDFSRAVVDTYPEIVLSVITMIFMSSAFCAGWFYMVKKCVQLSKKHYIMDNDKSQETKKLLKALLNGVGHYFIYFVLVSLLFLAIAMIMVYFIKLLSAPYAAKIYDIFNAANISVATPQDISISLDKLPTDKIIDLFYSIIAPSLKLLFIVAAIPAVTSFLLMLWMPEIIYTRKNPIAAIFTSIKKIFIKFSKSLKLYIYIVFIQMIVSLISSLSLVHPILYLFAAIVYFYFLVYVVVLIFSYYDEEFGRCKQ